MDLRKDFPHFISSCFYQRIPGVGFFTKEIETGAERTARQGQWLHSLTWRRRTKQVCLRNQVQPAVQVIDRKVYSSKADVRPTRMSGQQDKIGVSKTRSWSARYKASSISQAGAKDKGQSWNAAAKQRRWTEIFMRVLIAVLHNLAVFLGWSRIAYLWRIGDDLEHVESNPGLGKGACWCIQGLDSFLTFPMAAGSCSFLWVMESDTVCCSFFSVWKSWSQSCFCSAGRIYRGAAYLSWPGLLSTKVTFLLTWISQSLILIPFLDFVSLNICLPIRCSGMARLYPLAALCDAHKNLGCSLSLKMSPGENKSLSNLAHFMCYGPCIQSFYLLSVWITHVNG